MNLIGLLRREIRDAEKTFEAWTVEVSNVKKDINGQFKFRIEKIISPMGLTFKYDENGKFDVFAGKKIAKIESFKIHHLGLIKGSEKCEEIYESN